MICRLVVLPDDHTGRMLLALSTIKSPLDLKLFASGCFVCKPTRRARRKFHDTDLAVLANARGARSWTEEDKVPALDIRPLAQVYAAARRAFLDIFLVGRVFLDTTSRFPTAC